MSKSKAIAAIVSLSVAVCAFTVWNVIDFCQNDTHSTAAYLAVAFNFIAVVELVHLIRREVKRGEKQ